MEALVTSGLPDELSALRDKAGLSRKRLGDLAGLSDGTIRLIESGESEQPHPETLRSLAKGLATQQLSGKSDPDQIEAIYLRLMRAAGYLPEILPAEIASEIPADIYTRIVTLVEADEGLMRAITADLARRSPEAKRAALRFWAEALQWQRESAPRRPTR